MPDKTETNKNTVPAPQVVSIEELQQKKKTPAPTFSGVCAAMGWKAGKMVTENEFDAAVRKFSGSPIGKKVK
ncbi:hypothetical protein LY28_02761 [Ruminiclostridium sufflavum DSM 19573]|uniref:Uncharacterized protein n=1 Tax=Ruminiclostridium sufflavum DSM 19573 TaxID=1121337 RepID=A0A318XHS1_9FIRM|nr:hypothetical protein [Ruminiclostridium sufflavum]PYG86735.1 hypothetical protein LY28_02761 [Ruminiclostridium sufflavum DSM 19573]